MSSKVEVLCPNGHRVYVKTNPNTTLIKILEEACTKQGFPANEFCLKHGKSNKTLDLTLTMRFAGLPNNAKLELTKADKPRTENEVTLAVQVPSGERLKGIFSPNDTLWAVLEHLEKETTGCLTKSGFDDGNQQPVCVYMREEVIGEFALRETTLKQLGLLAGSGVIRLLFKPVEEETLKQIKDKINKEKARQARLLEKKPVCVTDAADEVMDTTGADKQDCHTAAPESMETETSEQTNNSPMPQTLQTMQNAAPFSVLPGIFPPDPPARDVRPRREPEFSILRISQVTRPVITDFKFPEATKGMDLYQNELTNDREVIKYRPCDRDPICYNLDEIRSSLAVPEEPGDDFFELNVTDVQTMYHEQQQRLKEEEEASLMTTAMRKARAEERLAKYDHAFIRFTFPDKLVLQATFRPKEPVYNLYKFIKSQLEDEGTPFYLFTSPPKKVLNEQAQTLIDAKLVPMTVVYVSSEGTVDRYLSSTVTTHIQPQQEANRKVVETMHRPVKRPAETGDSPPKAKKDSTKASEPKVPKWFKVGKK